MRRFLWLLALLAAGGCAAGGKPAASSPVAGFPVRNVSHRPAWFVIWSADLQDDIEQWRPQIERRFAGCLVLVCHGTDDGGIWTLCPDPPRPWMPAADAAWVLHDVADGRAVVIWSCNPSHRLLMVPGVWYARELVWAVPDSQLDRQRYTTKTGIGDIRQFIQGIDAVCSTQP